MGWVSVKVCFLSSFPLKSVEGSIVSLKGTIKIFGLSLCGSSSYDYKINKKKKLCNIEPGDMEVILILIKMRKKEKI